MLVRYELQKVFTKRANQIILILLAVLMAYSCGVALMRVEWVDERGNSVTRHAAAVKLLEASREWSGPLDQELLEKALAELKEIYSSTEVDAQSQESNWLLRNKLQGVQEIADLLGWSFVDDYGTFEEMIGDLQPEDLSRFYANRIENRKAWLYEDESSWGYYNYSEAEKQFILSKFEALQTPLETGYHEGWVQAIEQLPTLLKYGIILLSFVLAGVFSDEFAWKTDTVYYNTLHGRTRATAVKVGLGFLMITVAYWLCVSIYSSIVLGNLGTEGGNCSIQVHSNYWNIREQMTFRQFYLLAIGAGYLGYLFIGFLVLWISAKTKSPVLAVLIPSLLLLLPGFLHEFYSPTMRRVIGILPDKLLDIGEAIQYLYLYTVKNHVMTAVPIVLTVYPCITVLLVFLCYREYRHKQIA
ncbi:hypothetical protein [Ruminococcus champanellensis]|uniref:hypothetical protein n=1 Tax=Ruminococcus champanellensis TaxID=1161942 RepID=UPI0023F39043|nr:hypothetical protein [Ruminococcus champanellensis]